jgi:hypothetical protein
LLRQISDQHAAAGLSNERGHPCHPQSIDE